MILGSFNRFHFTQPDRHFLPEAASNNPIGCIGPGLAGAVEQHVHQCIKLVSHDFEIVGMKGKYNLGVEQNSTKG